MGYSLACSFTLSFTFLGLKSIMWNFGRGNKIARHPHLHPPRPLPLQGTSGRFIFLTDHSSVADCNTAMNSPSKPHGLRARLGGLIAYVRHCESTGLETCDCSDDSCMGVKYAEVGSWLQSRTLFRLLLILTWMGVEYAEVGSQYQSHGHSFGCGDTGLDGTMIGCAIE